MWVSIDVGGGLINYLWRGEHKFHSGKIDVIGNVKTLLSSEPLKLVNREDVLRGVYGSGGLLSPSFFCVIIRDEVTKETTLYTAWQGTMFKTRPMDVITDLAAAPVRAGLWDTVYPYLWVHSGFYAKVQHDFCSHKETILKLVIEFKVTKIIFTGHSLGGACAQVAHVAALAEFDKMSEEERKLLGEVNIQSITFAAPMAFFMPEMRMVERRQFGDRFVTFDTVLMEKKEDAEKAEQAWALLGHDEACREKFEQLLDELAKQSVNYLFDKDIIPHLPGHSDYFGPALKVAARSAVMEFVPTWEGKLDELVNKFCKNALDMEAIDMMLEELKHFKHLGKLHFCKAGSDGKSLVHDAALDDMPKWEEDETVTWQYLWTCHSVIPSNILYQCP